jgi:hypothetical protein
MGNPGSKRNRVKSITSKLSSLLVIVTVGLTGCGTVGNDTVNELAWGEMLRLCRPICQLTYEDCKQVQSLKDALDLSEKKGFVTSETRKKLREADPWWNPYIFERKVADDQIIFRLISQGENGVFENGRGDDITCEITIPKRGNGTLTLIHKNKTISRR